MTQRTLFLRVGALLAFSALLLVTLILILTGDRLRAGHAYESYFSESVQGLEIGAPVKYRGVTMGHVTGIGLASAEYGTAAEEQIVDAMYRLIVVRYKLDPRRLGKMPDTETAVRHGLRARLANQGLTGVMFVELDFLPTDQYPAPALPWVPLDDFIPAVPSTIAQVQDQVTDILKRFDSIDFPGIAQNIDGLVGDLRHEIGSEGDLHTTLAEARTTIADLRTELKNANLHDLSTQLRSTGAAIETLAQGRQTRAILDSAQADLQRLPPLINSLQRTVDRAGGGVADLQSELMPILDDVRAAVENLRETTETIRRDPGSVLQQGPPPRDHPR